MSALISAENLCFDDNGRSILHNINLNVQPKEIVTIIGPNGAGKSTLIKILLGLIRNYKGSVSKPDNLTVGYMPQKMTINPSLPINVKRFLGLTGASAQQIEKILDELSIKDIANAPMQTISGGEQQRILLARALLAKPQLLILDEPVQGVDLKGQTELYQLITDIRDQYGCGILMVSHDLHVVMAKTDHVICLNQHVCCHGHPEQVSSDPAYLALFGQDAVNNIAIYTHDHDHDHNLHGDIVDGHCQHD